MSYQAMFPNLNHLRYFHVVAEEGSIKAAAERLHVTEPTISHQVRQVEEFLGAKLFDRESGGLRLNDAGRQVFEQTSAITQSIDRMLNSFGLQDPDQRIRLEVGVTSTVTSVFAGRYFVPLYSDDDVLVRVRQGDYSYLVKDLLNGELDILLSENLPTEREAHDLKIEPVHEPTLVFVTTPECADELDGDIPGGLNHVRFMHYTPRSKYRFEVDQYLSTHGIFPDIVGETDNVEIMMSTTVQTGCVSVLPADTARAACDEGKLVILARLDDAVSTVYAVFKSVDPHPSVVRAVGLLRQGTGYELPED